MAKAKKAGSVISSEGLQRLLEEGREADLNDDERALLVALISTESEAGRELSAEEKAALERLKSQVGDYDPEELAQAVRHMVKSRPREDRKLEWPELRVQRRK
ncbi:MAG: hypothetical protein N2508_02255 [Anaerolineae bacterium]|nr:hypothetical protein [Anaerolineae bacterium]